ncbi:techylectin-5B-like [Saccostrea echinata]|uniref:techylectin-5B-like n=1 Tax=Saccostrea echinata TaxID=191078 RepID=UPI002A84040C|nr:techylectin-5B-like [Saccostrea echinata]
MQASKIVFAFLAVYAASLLPVTLTERTNKRCAKCSHNPCLNGGIYEEYKSQTGTSKLHWGKFKLQKGPQYICICPEEFTGEICQIKVCDEHDCRNGICVADHCKKRGYKCNCIPGYIGDNCEVHVCDRHDCKNGICEEDKASTRGYRCTCTMGYVGNNCEVLPRDCKDVKEAGQNSSGVYEIFPHGNISSPVRVECDMETLDSAWTVIQKRVNGSLSFYRAWDEYKNGFGAPEQDIWIGNDVIHQLTKGNDSSLYVSITLVNDTTLYELYNRFSVSDEEENYQLFLGGPATGTLGDRMFNTGDPNYYDLSGMSFTTWDRDNDRSVVNCASNSGKGGWWFNSCYYGFLNGPWNSTDWIRPWYPPVEYGTEVRGTLMMVTRV